jgi:hypothetical protein
MSGMIFARVKPRRATVEAVITRADGTVEKLGVIAYHHRNPVWSFVVNVWISIRRRFTG